jgi:hypothetical protein
MYGSVLVFIGLVLLTPEMPLVIPDTSRDGADSSSRRGYGSLLPESIQYARDAFQDRPNT